MSKVNLHKKKGPISSRCTRVSKLKAQHGVVYVSFDQGTKKNVLLIILGIATRSILGGYLCMFTHINAATDLLCR